MLRERSQSIKAAESRCRKWGWPADEGFSLIEVLVAMVILTIGLVAMAQLLAVATRMHADSREASAAAQLAQAQMDALVKLPFTSPFIQISAGDPLSSNVANYFDQPVPGITRRWSVQAGPVAGTRVVTVRVVNDRGREFGGQFQVTTIIREW